MIVEITEQELLVIKDTLERIQDEVEVVVDFCDHVFNSGAIEGISDSLDIVNALVYRIHKQRLNECELI